MLALTTSLSSIAFAAQALDTYNIDDAAGNAFMQLRIFGVNDDTYVSDGEQEFASTWSLQQSQADQILDAVRYWGEVVGVVAGQNPAIINVSTYDDRGASAFSPTSIEQAGSGTLVQAAWQDGQSHQRCAWVHQCR